jgi:hypothetical protein
MLFLIIKLQLIFIKKLDFLIYKVYIIFIMLEESNLMVRFTECLLMEGNIALNGLNGSINYLNDFYFFLLSPFNLFI